MKKILSLSIVLIMLFSVVLGVNGISAKAATVNDDLNYVDLNNWQEDFPVDQSNGTWTIEDGGRSLIQSVNDDPTGYLTPDTSIDEIIMGTIEVEYPPEGQHVDNDFIGFILGYQDPNESSGSYDYDFILFDWRRGDQDNISMEGYTLKKIDGTVTTNDYNEYFWDNINDSSDNDMTILAANHNNNGWNYEQRYLFKILYTKDKIKIKVDDEVVFDISGTFKDGKYGFYNYSQPYVKYGEVKSAQGSSTSLAPVAEDDNYVVYLDGTEEAKTLEIDRFNGILANDYDPYLDGYDIITQSSVSNGTLNLSTTSGAFTYISDGSTGKDTFSYVLRESENINEESTTATATISVVEGSNETPSALNITPTSISYSGSDIDLETDKIDDIDYVVGKINTEDQEGDYHDYMLIDNSDGKFGIKDNEIFIADNLEKG